MDLTFGDMLANALAEIKAYSGKKIGIIQDEISFSFSPALSSKTIESWRYRPAPPTVAHLETLAAAVVEYGCPDHDAHWLVAFLEAARHPYPQAVVARLFPAAEEPDDQTAGRVDPPPLGAYAPPRGPDLIGRTNELDRYRRLLARPGLAVISGMAGVGKTALAARLAAERPAGRVFWHTFRHTGAQALVYRLAGFLAHHRRAELWEMLEAARLSSSPPPDLTVAADILAAQLPHLALLLCLDDYHLAEADAHLQFLLDTILQHRPRRVRLLLTTRRHPVSLPIASQVALEGLSLADTRRLLARRDVSLPESLFARLHEVTAGNGTFLTLAASALRDSDRPADLIDRLAQVDDIERFLMTEVNDHLSPVETQIMAAVALQGGQPATRALLEHMLPEQNVRRPLRNLEDRFLLESEADGLERAYAQHQIIQTFYQEQPRRARREALHARAAKYFHRHVFDPFQTTRHTILAGRPAPGVRLAREHLWAMVNDGVAAELLGVLEAIPPADLDVMASLDRDFVCGRLHGLRGAADEAQRHWEAAAARLNDLPASDETAALKGEVCLGMAELLERQAPRDALTWVNRGLEIVPPSARRLAAALKTMAGTVQMHMGNFGGALEMIHDGLDGLEDRPSPARINGLKNLGAAYFNLGRLPEAAAFTEQALAMSRGLGDHLQTARICINLGPIRYAHGDWPGAVETLEQGLAIAHRLGSLDTIRSLHTNLGGVYVEMGDHKQARNHLHELLRLTEKEEGHQVVTARVRLAQLANYEGNWAAAERELDQAEALARRLNDQASLATIHGVRAAAALGAGRAEEAYALVEQALTLDHALGDNFSRGENLRVLGEAAAALGRVDEAAEVFGRSLKILDDLDPYQAALTRLSWAGWLLELERDVEEAREMLAAAGRRFETLGARREIAAVGALTAGR